jgi:hypothetical protein
MPEHTPTSPLENSAGSDETADLIDRELVRWFMSRGCSWSGTASELLVSLKNEGNVSDETLPPTAKLLCSHLEAHSAVLRSLGVDASLRQGWPPTVSLKSTAIKRSEQVKVSGAKQPQNQNPRSEPNLWTKPSPVRAIPNNPPTAIHGNESSTSLGSEPRDIAGPMDLASAMREITQITKCVQQRMNSADVRTATPAAKETKQTVAGALFAITETQEQIRTRAQTPAADSAPLPSGEGTKTTSAQGDASTTGPRADDTESIATPSVSENNSVEHVPMTSFAPEKDLQPVFENAGEALSSILELQKQIKEYDEPGSVLSIVARAAEQMSKARGIAVGLTQHDKVVHRSETGVATYNKEFQCESSFFVSSCRTGAISQIQDAEGDGRLGPACSRAGIKSIIVSPFPVGGGLSGAIEFLFAETRALQRADVITLQIISETVQAALGDLGKIQRLQGDSSGDNRQRRTG